jgi:hypothetical protein
MPNFDFLNADDSGKSAQPRAVEVQTHRYQTWGWSVEAKKWYESRRGGAFNTEVSREYSLACLTDDAFYVRNKYKSMRDRSADISELSAFAPEAVFKKDFHRIPLSSIYRLCYSDHSGTLDLIAFDERSEQITDLETKQTKLIFETLHKRLAESAPIESVDVHWWTNLAVPLAMFTPILLIACTFLVTALASDEERSKLKPSDFRIMFLESFGTGTMIALCVAALLAGLGFIVYRHLKPLQAQSVVVKS